MANYSDVTKNHRMRRDKTALEAKALAVFKQICFEPLSEREPVKYIEARRLEYIKRVELIADEARANGMPDLELKAVAYAIRLSSLYKTKLDVTASNLGLIKPPDMSKLSQAELEALERGDELTVTAIAKRLPDPDDSLN